eukprot:gene26053-31456_t
MSAAIDGVREESNQALLLRSGQSAARPTDDPVNEDQRQEEMPAVTKRGLEAMDKLLQVQETAAFSLDAATKFYETFHRGDAGQQAMIADAVSVAGGIADSVFPVLLDLGKTVPLVGPVAAVALQLYVSVKTHLENKEDVQDLTARVQDCLIWFKHTGPCLRKLSLPQQEKLEECVSRLVGAMQQAQGLLEQWRRRNSVSKVVLSERDKDEIHRLAGDLERARGDLSLHATSVLFQVCLQEKGQWLQGEELQELRRLVGAVETSFRADVETHLARFVQGSRNWMHEIVRAWLETDSRLFWVLADAGMGKSAFAASLVEYLEPRGRLAACFFCRHGHRNRSKEEAVVMSLVLQIAERFEACRGDILRELRAMEQASRGGGVSGLSLRDRIAALLLAPLKKLGGAASPCVVIVVDALDEVGVQGSRERRELLHLLAECLQLLPPWVKLLATSRPEADILASFARFEPTMISAEDPRHREDLRAYMRTHLPRCLQAPEEETSAAVELLMHKSEGRFVYVSLVAQDLFLGSCNGHPQKHTLASLEAVLPTGLDEVYRTNFERIRNASVRRFQQRVRPLVRMLTSMLEPLPLDDAQRLLECEAEELEALAGQLSGMFPVVGEGRDRCFTLFHKTLADWLRDEHRSRQRAAQDEVTLFWLQELLPDSDVARVQEYLYRLQQEELGGFASLRYMCSDEDVWRACLTTLPALVKARIRDCVQQRPNGSNGVDSDRNRNRDRAVIDWEAAEMRFDFFVDARQGHAEFAERILRVLGVPASSVSWDSIASALSSRQLLAATSSCGYLLRHAVEHLVEAGCEQGARALQLQLQLPWLLLGLTQRPRGVWDVLADLRYSLRGSGDEGEAEDGLRRSLRLLEGAVSLSASSIAVGSAEQPMMFFVLAVVGRLRRVVCGQDDARLSALRQLVFSCEQWLREERRLEVVKFGLEVPGGPLLGTLQGHESGVDCVCISADCGRIASSSSDGVVKVWNATAGECLQTLRGHAGGVKTMATSADGHLVVSGGRDTTIRVWNVESGACSVVLHGHTAPVETVAVSSDGGRIASASQDGTLRIWDSTSGECVQIVDGVFDHGTPLCLSADGSHAVFALMDKTIRLWDIASSRCLLSLREQEDSICAVSLSADDTSIVSICKGGTVRVWDAVSGNCLATSQCGSFHKVWLSPCCNRVVLTDFFQWSVIKLYDLASGELLQVLPSKGDNIQSICMSADGRFVVSGSWDKNIKIWDARHSTEGLYDCKAPDSSITNMVVSSSGGRIFFGYQNRTIKVFDVQSREIIQTLSMINDVEVAQFCVSADGTRLLSPGRENDKSTFFRVLDVATGECLMVQKFPSKLSVDMSSDGRLVVSLLSHSHDSHTTQIWDVASGQCLQSWQDSCYGTSWLNGAIAKPLCLFLDSSRLVTVSQETTLVVWDTLSGERVGTLQGHDERITCVSASIDGQRIVSSSSYDRSIKVWDAVTGACVYTVYTGLVVVSCALSTDGHRIVTRCFDPANFLASVAKVWDIRTGGIDSLPGHISFDQTADIWIAHFPLLRVLLEICGLGRSATSTHCEPLRASSYAYTDESFGAGQRYGEIGVTGLMRESAAFADIQVLSILHKRKLAEKLRLVTDSAAFAKKRVVTPATVYSGLLDAVKIAESDLDDPQALQASLRGVDGWLAFNVSAAQVPAFASLAVDLRLQRLVLAVREDSEAAAYGHAYGETMQQLAESGVNATILRYEEPTALPEARAPYRIMRGHLPLPTARSTGAQLSSVGLGDLLRIAAEAFDIAHGSGQVFGVGPGGPLDADVLAVMRAKGLPEVAQVSVLLSDFMEVRQAKYMEEVRKRDQRQAAERVR